jgi:beta-lactam-binding protein with PASTA domain
MTLESKITDKETRALNGRLFGQSGIRTGLSARAPLMEPAGLSYGIRNHRPLGGRIWLHPPNLEFFTMKHHLRILPLLLLHLLPLAFANVSITDSFFFQIDAANDAGFSLNPGSDGGLADDFTADAPVTIATTGFSAVGASKLVAVVCLHNSAAAVAPVSDITYGGVSLIGNEAGGTGATTSASLSGRQMVFYLDAVAADGDLVIDWDPNAGNIDEVSVALFALSGTEAGGAYYNETVGGGTGTLSSFNATAGDFLLGVGQRNNGGDVECTEPSYTGVELRAGNLNAEAAYRIATAEGTNAAPTFSNLVNGGPVRTMVAFAAAVSLQVQVPDIVGLTQAAAESAITGASLTVGASSSDFSPSIPAGSVISQSPAAGQEVLPGTNVDLVISLGPAPQVGVPSVVGLDQASAEADLISASLSVGSITLQNDPVVPAGEVISQNPAAGSTVDVDSPVDLTVSLGPQPLAPDVIELTQAEAESAITGASLAVGGINIDFSDTVPAGDVIAQEPAAGTPVDTGSAVNLVISLGPNPAPGTIVDLSRYRFDFAPEDTSVTDFGGAPSLVSIPTSGFTAAGSDKLVAILSIHNSAFPISAPITSLTYGGVSLFENLAAGSDAGAAGFTKHHVFYLDEPAADGDLVIGVQNLTSNIDELGVQLFALNGLAPGMAYATETQGSANFITTASAAVGDFVVGVAQRNNQPGTITVTNGPPYSGIDLTVGNLTSTVAYQVVSSPGPTTPDFSGSVQLGTFAAFAAAGAPPSSGYGTWASVNAPTTGGDLAADEDGDGVPNGVEFVLGGGISSIDLDKLPTASSGGGNLIFSFERLQQSIDSSLTVSIEVSADLVTWPDVFPVPEGATSGPPIEVMKDTTPGFDTVSLSVAAGGDIRQFVRLKVEEAP